MTTFTVDTLSDDPDDGLTLREALALADDEAVNAGADRIEFASAIQGGKITLAGSELTVASDVTIDGGTGVTIDANQLSRVLLIGDGTFDEVHEVTLTSLTVTGGKTTADNAHGGGIRAGNYVDLELSRSSVIRNSTTGYAADGGGIFSSEPLTLRDSTVSGNSTAAREADGGGIRSPNMTLTNSTVSGNSTAGINAWGGGLAGNEMTLTNSTVSGNSTSGYRGYGGGLNAVNLTLTNSTVSGNSTTGEKAYGGGFRIEVSGTLSNSIVAGNSATAGNADIRNGVTASNGHNLFGSDVSGNVAGDLENVSTALLFAGGLADNGGPTRTIALLNSADNPALGGALAIAGLDTDQRGEIRPAPAGTDPDIGAFELGGSPALIEIVGTSRKDFLKGTDADEIIRGLASDDVLWGRGGDDQLFGGKGDDVLFGKAGIDQSTGGLGADRFVFRTTGEAPPDGPAYEEILDFNRGQGDKIDLRTIDANEGAPGNQPFAFVDMDPLASPAQLRFEAFDSDFLVTANTDADPAADLAFIVRTGAASLMASDFLL